MWANGWLLSAPALPDASPRLCSSPSDDGDADDRCSSEAAAGRRKIRSIEVTMKSTQAKMLKMGSRGTGQGEIHVLVHVNVDFRF